MNLIFLTFVTLLLLFRIGSDPRMFVPIKNIGSGYLVMLASHQGQFNLVLDVFNMDSTAAG